MKVTYFSIKSQYDIRCKLYTPDDEHISHVIIGVHGFAGDKESSMLEKLATALSLHSKALICFDFPAHGDSPVGEEMLTVKNCKRDLCAVVEYVSNRYPNANKSLFATSFGGYISLLCADKLAKMPFILRAPAATMPKVLLENVLNVSPEEFKRREVINCGFERPIQLPYSFYEDVSSQETVGNKQITSPILIIHGDRDDIVPLSDIEVFAASQNNVTLQILHGADHRFKNVGEMKTIIDLVKTFVLQST